MPGEVPQVTEGGEGGGVDVELAVEVARRGRWGGCASRRRRRPSAAPCGDEAAALEVGEGGLVGGDHAGAGTGFDAHVADGHAAFHGEGADGGAGVLDDVAGGAVGADLADDVEDDVLGGDAEGELAVDV